MELKDPKVASGDADSDNVGGVGGSVGVWPVHWVAGVGAGGEAVAHCRLGYRLCVFCMWGRRGGSAGIYIFARALTHLGALRVYRHGKLVLDCGVARPKWGSGYLGLLRIICFYWVCASHLGV